MTSVAFEREATDEERRALGKHFARAGVDLAAGEWPGAPPETLDDASVAGHWVSWTFAPDAATECCLLQQRRAVGAEQPRLFAVTRDGRVHRMRTEAAHWRRTAAGRTFPSLIVQGHLIGVGDDDDDVVPTFVAWQCVWHSGQSRTADDVQTRMSMARQLVESDALSGGAATPPLQQQDRWLAFAYRPHQTPTQLHSVLVDAVPPWMLGWPLDRAHVVVRATDANGRAAGAGRRVSVATADDRVRLEQRLRVGGDAPRAPQ